MPLSSLPFTWFRIFCLANKAIAWSLAQMLSRFILNWCLTKLIFSQAECWVWNSDDRGTKRSLQTSSALPCAPKCYCVVTASSHMHSETSHTERWRHCCACCFLAHFVWKLTIFITRFYFLVHVKRRLCSDHCGTTLHYFVYNMWLSCRRLREVQYLVKYLRWICGGPTNFA